MPLKEKIIQRVQEEAGEWPYLAELPDELHSMQLQRLYRENEDMYELFSYTNEERHLGFCAYFHQETEEYKVRVWIGLTEFCLLQFITASFEVFQQHLQQYMEGAIHDLTVYNPGNMSYVTRELCITEWAYQGLLPEKLEGFELFISPSAPVRVLNGSYIVFDYSDFALKSNFIIYYNEFRCEFFGEARIKNIPEMNYVFDSKSITELEEKLREHLVERLKEIRQRSMSED
ncbi:hypothetical protein [Anaerovibrio sp.]|uniref:hypothetical protein n=1 Tax=Anaerovibrio sp. TaxID=1872532 RepID=UPI003F1786C7